MPGLEAVNEYYFLATQPMPTRGARKTKPAVTSKLVEINTSILHQDNAERRGTGSLQFFLVKIQILQLL